MTNYVMIKNILEASEKGDIDAINDKSVGHLTEALIRGGYLSQEATFLGLPVKTFYPQLTGKGEDALEILREIDGISSYALSSRSSRLETQRRLEDVFASGLQLSPEPPEF